MKLIREMSQRRFIPLLIPLAILLVFLAGAFGYKESLEARATVGQAAPEFTLMDLEGNAVSLSDFRGQVVMINFWTTWCEACREETPALQAFHEQYGDRVTQLGINQREPVGVIEAFMDEFDATYRVLRDTSASVAKLYRLRGVPETWFIDPGGVARVHWIGPMTFDQLVDAYQQTLAARVAAEDEAL